VSKGTHRRTWRFTSLTVAVAVAGGGARLACERMVDREVAVFAMEAVNEGTAAPFLEDLGVDLPGVETGQVEGGVESGASPDEFGGTHLTTQCDRLKLIKALMKDPAKARAWASEEHIKPSAITSRIKKLTSVILRKDTVVVNHGYHGAGRVSSYDSVLQAGMAVLVDAFGQPVVKCNCGNPLTMPKTDLDYGRSTYNGTVWGGFERKRLTVVRPGTGQSRITLADLTDHGKPTGKQYVRPVGTTGTQDLPLQPIPVTSPSPSESQSEPTGDPSLSTTSPTDGSPTMGTGTDTSSTAGGNTTVTAVEAAWIHTDLTASPETRNGQLIVGAQYTADCQKQGETADVSGDTSSTWVHMVGKGWVIATALDSIDSVPECQSE
jgi:hypothetical protein